MRESSGGQRNAKVDCPIADLLGGWLQFLLFNWQSFTI